MEKIKGGIFEIFFGKTILFEFNTKARHIDGQRPSPRTSIVANPTLTARTTNGALNDVPMPKIVR